MGTLYTHHEKMLIVDAPSLGDQRIVTSFVGGLDLCDGRWDTPTHSLFATLKTFHKNDFHNPTFSVSFPKHLLWYENAFVFIASSLYVFYASPLDQCIINVTLDWWDSGVFMSFEQGGR